ncbi:hypothetical protein HWV62_36773 [Athelia sp. TMB]|nr:hypothetical protein HWV62_36773 [Athelia sp. TMB]
MGGSRYPKHGISRPPRLDTQFVNPLSPASYYGPSKSPNGQRSSGARSPLEHEPEPFEEYCSPTRSATSGLNNLQRNRSTKQLISRFEILEEEAAPSRASRSFSRTTAPQAQAPQNPNIMKIRKPSPSRNSFRSFLSVFGKGKTSNKSNTFQLPPTDPAHIIRLNTPPPSSSATLDVPKIITRNLPAASIACITPNAIRTGSLLYLFQCETTQTAPVLPVWTSCTANLHQKHILLTWLTSQGNPSTHIIDLTLCTDVRSIPTGNISPDIFALLPSGYTLGDIKLFELVFDGLPNGAFATTSVRDRAEWIDEIWHVMLQAREQKRIATPIECSPRLEAPENLRINTNLAPYAPSSESSACSDTQSRSTPTTHQTNARSSMYSECSMSPVRQSMLEIDPPAQSPPTFPSRMVVPETPRGRSLLGSSSTTRTASPSLLTPNGTQLRSKSPSVAKLDHLSVVKQRLAEIESDPSRCSPSRSPSPSPSRKSTRSRQLSPIRAGSERSVSRDEDDQTPMRSAGSQRATSDCEVTPTAVRELPHIPPELFLVTRPTEDKVQLPQVPDFHAMLGDIHCLLDSKPGAVKEGIVQRLEAMKTQLDNGLPGIMHKLQEITNAHQDDLTKEIRSVAPTSPSATNAPATAELATIQAKLDDLLGLQKDLVEGARSGIAASPSLQAERDVLKAQALEQTAQLKGLLDSAKHSIAHQDAQTQQQLDTTRYLSELNTWLEAFVDGNNSQMQIVASGVEQLREGLGCAQSGLHPNQPPSGLMGDIKRLLVDSKNRDKDIETLQVAVNSLTNVVENDVRHNAEARNSATIEAIVDKMDRQRQEHDQLLKAISTRLTNEIRGERLRFVDAMKEATENRVQAHVDQFKKELTREVVVMAQEVGRLHKERRAVEQQIAELFSFYSAQKQKQQASMAIL